MFVTLIVTALVAVPFALELYFSEPVRNIEEEYVPDGR